MTSPLNPFVGTWAYRSLLNDPNLATDFNDLEFGRGTLVIAQDAAGSLTGTIGGPGWQLALYGGFGFGSAEPTRFRGSGVIGGEEWIYDYFALAVPVWPNSGPTLQTPAGFTVPGELPEWGMTRVMEPTSAGGVAAVYAVLQSA